MQLIYLYIDNYKNIKKQGFNFSPEFTCNFDGDSLTIEDNKDYINIFPDNVNVTALVGKNGSGKSSIFKFILMLIYYTKYKNLEKDKFEPNGEYSKFQKKEYIKSNNIDIDGTRGFLVIKTKDDFYRLNILVDTYDTQKKMYQIGIIALYDNQLINLKEIDTIDFFSIHFNYMLDTLKDNESDSFIDEIYHKSDSYETPLLLEPYKRINGKEQIDIENLHYLSYSKFANIFRLGITNKFIEIFFNPNFVKLDVNLEKLKSKIDILSKNIFGNPLVIVDNKNPITVGKEHIFRFIEPNDFKIIITELYNNKDFFTLNRIYIAFKILEKDYWHRFNWQYIYDTIFSSKTINETINNIVKNINLSNIEKKLKNSDIPQYEYQKILNAIKFENKILNKDIQFQSFLNKKNKLDDVKNILEYIAPWIDIEYFEDDKSYKSLSSGEKTVFAFMINLMYQINNIKDTKYKTINIFLDEVELGLHPEWQKRFLQYIIKTIENSNIKINLIFATHSPFILSDIPKENIIFLDNGKNVSAKVDINTFGANIHTLLSHGFFMEDGLIGEFAKNKINNIIKLLNKQKLSKEELDSCENIVSMIGEPLIKNQLQKVIDSKRLFRIDNIETKIEILEKKLQELKNAKN